MSHFHFHPRHSSLRLKKNLSPPFCGYTFGLTEKNRAFTKVFPFSNYNFSGTFSEQFPTRASISIGSRDSTMQRDVFYRSIEIQASSPFPWPCASGETVLALTSRAQPLSSSTAVPGSVTSTLER
jgi:hypothetical protein